MHDEGSAAVLAAEARRLAQRAESIALPARHLDGWSSLCAHEYSVGIARLDDLRRELEASVHTLVRALHAG